MPVDEDVEGPVPPRVAGTEVGCQAGPIEGQLGLNALQTRLESEAAKTAQLLLENAQLSTTNINLLQAKSQAEDSAKKVQQQLDVAVNNATLFSTTVEAKTKELQDQKELAMSLRQDLTNMEIDKRNTARQVEDRILAASTAGSSARQHDMAEQRRVDLKLDQLDTCLKLVQAEWDHWLQYEYDNSEGDYQYIRLTDNTLDVLDDVQRRDNDVFIFCRTELDLVLCKRRHRTPGFFGDDRDVSPSEDGNDPDTGGGKGGGNEAEAPGGTKGGTSGQQQGAHAHGTRD